VIGPGAHAGHGHVLIPDGKSAGIPGTAPLPLKGIPLLYDPVLQILLYGPVL